MIDYNQILSYKNKNNLSDNPPLDNKIKIINEVLCKINNTPVDKNNNWRAEKPIFLRRNEADVMKIRESDINSSLNKISKNNINDVIKYLLDGPLKKNVETNDYNRLINFTIENLFTKAVEQVVYCPLYVKLINSLKVLDSNVINTVIDKCNKFKYIIKEYSVNSYSNCINKSYEDFCKNMKDKSYKMGYSQFLGELYNNNLVSIEIINENVSILFSNIENRILEDPKNKYIEENIVCVSKLLMTISDKKYISSFADKLKNIKSVKELPKMLQFKILDIIEHYSK